MGRWGAASNRHAHKNTDAVMPSGITASDCCDLMSEPGRHLDQATRVIDFTVEKAEVPVTPLVRVAVMGAPAKIVAETPAVC